MGLVHDIGRYVAATDADRVPAEVKEKLQVCLLNGYGIALGGVNTPGFRVAIDAALDMDGVVGNGATLLCDGRRTTIGGAVIANSALFHARGQEDTCGTVHIGAIVIPLLTAMVEAKGLGTRSMLSALLAAYEVAGLLDKAYGAITAPAGVRATALYGTIGAAAAVARLMELDERQTAAAIANAAAFTGGTLQAFAEGSDEWRYQVGVAARNGLVAAQLAKAGSVSAGQAIEGPAGLVRAYARQDCDADLLLRRLETEWSTLRVTFKPFPVCAFNQTPVTAALALREELGGRTISAARVRMNPYETGYAGMLSKGPFTTVAGTVMSIPFCIATALLHGAPDLRRMADFGDARVAELIARTEVVTDASVPNLCAVIELDLADGTTLARDQRMGFADYAYDWSRVSQMVRDIGRQEGIPAETYDRLESFVRGIGHGSISVVTSLFPARDLPNRKVA